MRIAIPELEGQVNQHFGRSAAFALADIAGGKVAGLKTVGVEGSQRRHEAVARLLKHWGVEVVVAGGIGPGAMEALAAENIRVVTGAAGQVQEVAEAFARQNDGQPGT